MARLAVLASGNGTNFQALALALRGRASSPRHDCVLLVYDRKAAYAPRRAEALGIPARYATYYGRPEAEAEAEIAAALDAAGADLVALAGFMRILSPAFVEARAGRIVNIHPSLLPKWPGARAIERAYEAGERVFGATVHYVDAGMDTGPVIESGRFERRAGESLAEVGGRVHRVEHEIYPRVVLRLLDEIDGQKGGAR